MKTWPPEKAESLYLKATVLGLNGPGKIVFAVDDDTGNSYPMEMGLEQARRWAHFKDHVLADGSDVVISAKLVRGHYEGFIRESADAIE